MSLSASPAVEVRLAKMSKVPAGWADQRTGRSAVPFWTKVRTLLPSVAMARSFRFTPRSSPPMVLVPGAVRTRAAWLCSMGPRDRIFQVRYRSFPSSTVNANPPPPSVSVKLKVWFELVSCAHGPVPCWIANQMIGGSGSGFWRVIAMPVGWPTVTWNAALTGATFVPEGNPDQAHLPGVKSAGTAKEMSKDEAEAGTEAEPRVVPPGSLTTAVSASVEPKRVKGPCSLPVPPRVTFWVRGVRVRLVSWPHTPPGKPGSTMLTTRGGE